jgi:hypothetical protein
MDFWHWNPRRFQTIGPNVRRWGAKYFGVFRVKNHDFTPKNHIFSNFVEFLYPPLLLLFFVRFLGGDTGNLYRNVFL